MPVFDFPAAVATFKRFELNFEYVFISFPRTAWVSTNSSNF